ncbi:nucleotide disphospho-sugar-binding domain-containing protein [Streptomyces sp. NPDC003032]
MRVLFTTYAERAHLLPLAPLAWALVNEGHEVRVASSPMLTDAISATGLTAVPVGQDIDIEAVLARGDLAPVKRHPDESQAAVEERVMRNMAGLLFAFSRATSADLVAFGRSWRPDLIVHDPITFNGLVAGQALGVPVVGHLYGMARWLRPEFKDLIGGERWEDYAGLFEGVGAEPVTEPVAWVDPRPASLIWSEHVTGLPAAPLRHRLPMRYIPYNGSGTVPRELTGSTDRPRVVVTWGTSQQRKLGPAVADYFGDVVRAVAATGAEVVLTLGEAGRELVDRLGPLPEHVRPIGWAPLNALLAGSDAIVHTGGTGVLMTAAAHGVPQLGITSIREGLYNTQQLASTGAGLHLEQRESDPFDVKTAVEKLLGDAAHRTAADRLRQEIADCPAPAEVARKLETLL